SGNTNSGINIFAGAGQSTTGNSVVNNIVGLAPDGDTALANGSKGSRVGHSGTGGVDTTTNTGNTGSRNTGGGVRATGPAPNSIGEVKVRGNLVGTNAAGTAKRPNTTTGVTLTNGASTSVIGGTTAADRNVVSGNGTNGIVVTANATTVSGVTVTGNYVG